MRRITCPGSLGEEEEEEEERVLRTDLGIRSVEHAVFPVRLFGPQRDGWDVLLGLATSWRTAKSLSAFDAMGIHINTIQHWRPFMSVGSTEYTPLPICPWSTN